MASQNIRDIVGELASGCVFDARQYMSAHPEDTDFQAALDREIARVPAQYRERVAVAVNLRFARACSAV
jgi:hypothetical protein